MQLTNETYVDATAMLSKTVKITENNTNEQTGQVLDKVANYFDTLANFVNESNVNIDTNVCVHAWHKNIKERLSQIYFLRLL